MVPVGLKEKELDMAKKRYMPAKDDDFFNFHGNLVNAVVANAVAWGIPAPAVAALGLVYGGDLILLGADGWTVSGGTNTNGVTGIWGHNTNYL